MPQSGIIIELDENVSRAHSPLWSLRPLVLSPKVQGLSAMSLLPFAERFGSRMGASFGARQSRTERTLNDKRFFIRFPGLIAGLSDSLTNISFFERKSLSFI
jgi:hypothetical protein